MSDEKLDEAIVKHPRYELKIKIQIGPLGIVYPQRTEPTLYIDLSRHGLIQIGRLWIDW